MQKLTPGEMMLVGEGRCGGAWSSIAIEATCGLAGAFVGFGLAAAHPAGAIWGARAGLLLGGLLCDAS